MNSLEIAKTLIENGADPNNKEQVKPFKLLTMIVYWIISILIVLDLINFNKTPLLYAIEKNAVEFLKLFIEKGADVNYKGNALRAPINSHYVHCNMLNFFMML